MKRIPLTQNKFALVDDDDFDYLNQWKWSIHKNGYATYAGKFLMHRIITKVQKGFQVDHINGNKLDNRKSNLRVCTSRQNTQNSKHHIDNVCGYKGVHERTDRPGTFVAQIVANKIHYFIGSYSSAIDAAKAYDKKRKNCMANLHI